MFAVAGVGLVAVWMGALGAVAYSRSNQAQPGDVALSTQPGGQPAIAVGNPASATAPVAALLPPAVAEAESAPDVAGQNPEPQSATRSTSKASSQRHSSRTASKRGRSTSKSKAYATRSTSDGSASSASAKRMKDDQLDALLKQFK